MAVRACPVSTCDWAVDGYAAADATVREHWEGHSELERRWAGPNPPPFRQTAECQYPCPGGCGVWVELSNTACLYCWALANPLTRQEARGLPPDHPRRPRRPDARQP